MAADRNSLQGKAHMILAKNLQLEMEITVKGTRLNNKRL